jgi:hypothetical protein
VGVSANERKTFKSGFSSETQATDDQTSDSPTVSGEHPQGRRCTNVGNIEKAQKGRFQDIISWNAELFTNNSRERLLSARKYTRLREPMCCVLCGCADDVVKMDSILQKIKRMIVFVEPGRIRPRVREIG